MFSPNPTKAYRMSSQNRRILYVGGFELPDKNAAAQRISVSSKLLKDVGYDVSFLGITHSNQRVEKNTCFDIEKNTNTSWSVRYPKSFVDWARYSLSIKTIKTIIEGRSYGKPVAIIAYNHPSLALFRLNRYCKKNKIILIADCTEWSIHSEKAILRIFKSIDTFLRMRWIHKSLDALIVISDFLFEYYNPKMNNVFLLPPLVDKNDPKWRRSLVCENNGPLKLVYAGSPGSRNKDRLDLIIKALNEVKSNSAFQLTIIGVTKEQYLFDFGLNSLPKGTENFVSFKGRLSHIETIGFVQRSDYSFFLRDNIRANNAGFPTKFVESISCGTPVITNETSNIKKFLHGNNLGCLLDDSTESNLVESLNKVIDSPKTMLKQLKKNCLNSSAFMYQNYIDDFEIFIKKAMNEDEK